MLYDYQGDNNPMICKQIQIHNKTINENKIFDTQNVGNESVQKLKLNRLKKLTQLAKSETKLFIPHTSSIY